MKNKRQKTWRASTRFEARGLGGFYQTPHARRPKVDDSYANGALRKGGEPSDNRLQHPEPTPGRRVGRRVLLIEE